jgi:hypothetical protein
LQVGDNLRAVEQHPPRGWGLLEHGTQQMASTAPDVGDDTEWCEVVVRNHPSDAPHRHRRHAPVIDVRLVRMGIEVGEEAIGMKEGRAGAARAHRVVKAAERVPDHG